MMKRKAWALLLIVVLLASLLPAAAFAAAAWAPNTSYKAGDIVSYGGSDYQCIQPHTSLVGWEPPNVPALWKLHSGGGTDTQPPTAPANLSVSGKTSTTVSLSWGASTDNVGVTGYDVYQGGALVGNAATTSYTVSGLTPSTSYTFTVKAKDAAGNVSAASNAVTVTTDGASTDTTPPTAPTGVSASNVTSSSVTLTWTASTDNVHRNRSDGFDVVYVYGEGQRRCRQRIRSEQCRYGYDIRQRRWRRQENRHVLPGLGGLWTQLQGAGNRRFEGHPYQLRFCGHLLERQTRQSGSDRTEPANLGLRR